MLFSKLRNYFPDYGISIENDVIEIRVQKDPVFWVTFESYGFKVYVGYNAPNSVEFTEIDSIVQSVKVALWKL